MIHQKIQNRFSDAVRAGDVQEVKRVLDEEPELLHVRVGGETWMHIAADEGHVAMLDLFFQRSVDVNVRETNWADRPLHKACASGHLGAARWLLDHGADVNAGEEEDAPTPLITPVREGQEDVVRLLIERGANVNATYAATQGPPRRSALWFAIERGHANIERLLREHGATDLPSPPAADDDPIRDSDAVIAHLSQHIGPVDPVAQVEIVPTGLAIAIHRIPPGSDRPWLTLFTTGLSVKPLEVSDGEELPARAELLMRLPPDWPSGCAALQEARFRWPFVWLRNLARELDDLGQQIPGWTIISNGEPPEPVCEGTSMSCFLLTISEELGFARTPRGHDVAFIKVFPLHTGERELALDQGVEALFSRLSIYDVPPVAKLVRPDVSRNAGP